MKATESVLTAVKIGEPELAGSIAVFPLFREDAGAMRYLLLDEALDRDVARVTEVSDAGHVPELCFENGSRDPVLLVDGDELVGARQNRIVNITILVGPGRKLAIPVSCVEQGRWSYRSARFAAAKRSLFASARARKMAAVSRSMRARGDRRSDQGELWGDIQAKLCERGVASETAAMSDIYESVETDLAGYEKAFCVHAGQSGAVFVSGHRVAGLELFDAPEAFAKCFPKMVRAYAMDAREGDPPVDRDAALADVRLAGRDLEGGALVDGDHVVHLAAYRTVAPEVP